MNKEDELHLSTQNESVNTWAWYISSTCKHSVEAVKLIDYLCKPEVNKWFIWGLGEEDDYEKYQEYPAYEIIDGKKVISDFMKNNPDMDLRTARDRYVLGYFRTALDEEMEKQQYDELEKQVWVQSAYKCDNRDLLPSKILMTVDESREFAAIMSQVDTYSSEMFYKFVTGLESLDKFDEYVKKIESYNIERAVEIQQAAYDRYLAR